ncbi:HEAT repeat domain-containing protein, partial [Gilliamella apicola]
MKKAEQLSTSPHASKQLIYTIFKRFSKLDKSLPTRIIEYILHGDELDVLVDFDKLCQISNNAVKLYELLEKPAQFYCSRYNYCSIDYGIHWLLKARNNFYKSWTDTYTPEQIVRYARVLAILFDHLHFIKHVSEQIPSWFIYLLYDGLITTLPCYCENKDKIEERENWSMQQLHQLLEIEQAGLGEKLLFAIFDRQNITATRFDFFEYFTRLNGLLSYIQDRIELFKQLPSLGLSLLGQVEQLNYIQRYPELQLQLVDFIVMQVSNTSKQVSQLAKEILQNLPRELVRPQLQHFLTSGSAKQRANAAILLSRIISEPTILQQALANETDKTVIAALESALIRLEIANAVKQQADLVIPRFEPLLDTPLPPSARDVLQQNFDEYLIECKKWMQNELEEKQKNKESSSTEHQNRYIKLKTVTSKSLDNIFEYLNGKIDRSTLFKEINEEIDFEFLFTKNRLLNLPEFSLFHLFRMNELLSSLE